MIAGMNVCPSCKASCPCNYEDRHAGPDGTIHEVDFEMWRYMDFWSEPVVLDEECIPVPFVGATGQVQFRATPFDNPAVSPLLTVTTTASAAGQLYFGPTTLVVPGSNQTFLPPGGVQFFTARASNSLLALEEVHYQAFAVWSNGTQGVLFTGRIRIHQGYAR